MKIAVLGSGMFVNGRGSKFKGVVIPSLFEYSKSKNIVIDLYLLYRNSSGLETSKNLCNLLDFEKYSNVNYIESDYSEDSITSFFKSNNIDGCIVVLPDHLHYKFCNLLLELNVNVMVVKPFVLSLSDAISLYKLQKKKNLIGQIEFHKRWDVSNRYAKSEFQNGHLGDVLRVDVQYSQNRDLPLNLFKKWCEKSNIFSYLGVHYVDLIYWMFGYLPVEVIALGSKGFLQSKGIDTYDSIDVLIKWSDNKDKSFISNISSNWVELDNSNAQSLQFLKILGTKKRIDLNQTDRGISDITKENGFKSINPYYIFEEYSENKINFSGYSVDSISSFMDNVFLKSNNFDNTSAFPDFEQGIISTSVIEAVVESLDNGSKKISINYDRD